MNFNTIWKEYEKQLLNFIITKVNDYNTAEDILQEVGIKLYENCKRKTVINNYKTWLFQVTRNTIIDYYRKKNPENQPIISQPEPTTNTNACVCDLSGFIIQQYLPKKYSKPLYLSDIEKIPQKEIAKNLNLSLTATKSRIQRGRKKLEELTTDCVRIHHNTKGEIIDFELKNNCQLPSELQAEIEKLNLIL